MNVDALAALVRRTPPQLSQRQFRFGLAGTTSLGGAFASGLLKPAVAVAGSLAPVPIRGGSPRRRCMRTLAFRQSDRSRFTWLDP
jgi:hypothetical protein